MSNVICFDDFTRYYRQNSSAFALLAGHDP